MSEEQVTLTMNHFEQRVLVQGMNHYRTELLNMEKPTEDVDDLLLKIIDAPPAKRKRDFRETR